MGAGIGSRRVALLALSLVGCAGVAVPTAAPLPTAAPITVAAPTVPKPPGCLPAELHGPLRARRGDWRLYVGASGDGWLLEHAGARVYDGYEATLELRARVDSSIIDDPVHGFGVGMCRADPEPAEERCALGAFAPGALQCSGAPTRGVCMGAFVSPGADPFVVAERLDRILGGGDDELCYGVVVRDGGPVDPL